MRVRFEQFVFDSAQRTLTRDGTRVHISPKALALLEALLQARPNVVSKPDLQSRIWPDVVVEEANLTNLVSELRGALDDDPRQPRFIRTAHGYGYAFVGTPVDEAEHRPRVHAAAPVIAAGVVLIAGIATLLSFGRIRTAQATPRQMTIERLPIDSLGSADISADKRFIAYTTRGRLRNSIRLRQLQSGMEIELVPPDPDPYVGHPLFSRDGNWVYYMRGPILGFHDQIRRVPVFGGPPETVVDLPKSVGSGFAFSPDGAKLAYSRESNDRSVLVIADSDGTNARDVATFHRPEVLCCSLSWSRDGSRILATMYSDDPPKPPFNLVVVNPMTGSVERLLAYAQYEIWNAHWLSNGAGFVALHGNGQLSYFAYPSLRRTPIRNPIGSVAIGSNLIDDSTILVFTTKVTSSLWTIDLQSPAGVNQITSGEKTGDGWWGVTWTADNRIVYSASNLESHSASLWMCDPDGGNTRELTRAAANVYDADPAASPDGRQIAFEEYRGDPDNPASSRILRIQSDGSDAVALTPADQFCEFPFFTPDGQFLLFNRGKGRESRLIKMPLSGGDAAEIPSDPVCVSGWGVDRSGKWIACCSDKSVEFVIPISGGKSRWTKDLPAMGLRWTPNGELSYHEAPGPPGNIFIQPLDDSPPKRITNFERGHIRDFAWSPSGHQLVIARRDTLVEAYLVENAPIPVQSR